MSPRLLVLMGSGETAPTMVKPHREVFSRLAGPAGGSAPAGSAPAVILDTPYGFQENAADISARSVDYFRRSVGVDTQVAGLGRVLGADPVTVQAALGKVARARWVFAGPGSPTYALSQWRGTEVPALLTDKLVHGGCVVFASAAALTLGAWTVPVYEIYKVGAEPVWLPGLDLLAPLGLPVAVIPHYDNAEGGGHDTRFCYLGERRLRILEDQLPDHAWVLGIDEHTACLIDFDAGEATVMGNGMLTVRRRGRSAAVGAGETLDLAELAAMAARLGRAGEGSAGEREAPAGGRGGVSGDRRGSGSGDGGGDGDPSGAATRVDATPLSADIRRLEAEFGEAIDRRDVEGAVRAILALEDELAAWATDTNQSPDTDRGRAALRRMVTRLGQLATVGARDPRAVVGPFVDALLAERDQARGGGRYADADRVRSALVALGVEVRDTASGTEWLLPGS